MIALSAGVASWYPQFRQARRLKQLVRAPIPERQAGWRVVPGSVYDGDTVQVARDGQVLALRLCGIDAPEIGQPGSIEARNRLRSLLPDEAVVVLTVVQATRDGYVTAEVWDATPPTSDSYVNSNMVLAGHAWHDERHSQTCPQREAIAFAAERAGRPRGMPPWEWRQAGERE